MLFNTVCFKYCFNVVYSIFQSNCSMQWRMVWGNVPIYNFANKNYLHTVHVDIRKLSRPSNVRIVLCHPIV